MTPAMIITLTNSKGGVGKSTLAVSLAVEWAVRGRRVLVLDADPQGTTLAWSELRAAEGLGGPTVLAVGDNIRTVLLEVRHDWDIVIVDTAGRQSKRVIAALRESDLVLMPCTPAGPDVWALAETIEVVREVQAIRDELRAAVVINGTTATKLATTAREAVSGMGVDIIATIARRTAIAESVTSGQSVVEREPKGAGATEIRALADAAEALVMEASRVA